MPENQLPADDRPRSVSPDLSSSSSANLFRPNFNQFIDSPSDNVSSLGSDIQIIQAYENVLPEIVHYEPVVIPKEPTLEEVIKEASGSTRLDTIKDLKICVISYAIGLQRISCFCPLLVSLNLEGSVISSLRDLGCFLTCLKHLNVSRCGLSNLDGTNGFSSLTHLIADNNNIEFVEPCSYLDNLEHLSLIGNAISNIIRMGFLSLCSKLRVLNVRDNQLTNTENYEEIIKTEIPKLVCLDGKLLRNSSSDGSCNEDSLTSNSDSSSLSDNSARSLDVFNNQSAQQTNSEPGQDTQNRRRPATTGSYSGRARPLSGIIYNLHQRRRRNFAWTGQIGLEMKDSSNSFLDKEFPECLPQIPVPLELGVIGLKKALHSSFEDDNQSFLLNIAKKWRVENNKMKEILRGVPENLY